MHNRETLLSIEAGSNLWDAEAFGLKLWPLVRVFLLGQLAYQHKGYQPITGEGRKTYLLPHKWPRYLRAMSFALSPHKGHYSALFMVNNLTRVPLSSTGHSVDRLHGEFFNRIHQPLILESSPNAYAASPDQFHEQRIFSQDAFWLWSYAQSRIQRLPGAISKQLEEFAVWIAEVFNAPEHLPRLIGFLERFVREYRVIRPVLEKYIAPKLAQKFALVTCAAYMGREALVTATLHDLGFHVAEAQHGLINPLHLAYNLPEAYQHNPLHPSRRYLPDTLLTYGDHWSGVTQMPSAKVAVGYPHLSKIVERSMKTAASSEPSILVLSQPTVTDRAADLACKLAAAFPKQQIIFKLHPQESHLTDRLPQLQALSNVTIIGRADVYELIARSQSIVGFSTTVLVEAVAFPGKRIFFNEPDEIPAEAGEPFADAEDLIGMLEQPDRGFPRCDPGFFWAVDWQARMDHFLERMSLRERNQ